MKFIKDIKNYLLNKELEKNRIKNYTINEDGSIDCNQDINFFCENLNEIPFKFNRINGNFEISNNKLKSLKNCAKYVEGYFDCSVNKLISLEFGPEYVSKNYHCINNKLETLKGCVEEVYGDFNCNNNELTSLEFCPMEVERNFDCSNNKLEYLDRSPLIKGYLYCGGMFNKEPEFSGSCKKLFWNL